jgi:hypothetical protein
MPRREQHLLDSRRAQIDIASSLWHENEAPVEELPVEKLWRKDEKKPEGAETQLSCSRSLALRENESHGRGHEHHVLPAHERDEARGRTRQEEASRPSKPTLRQQEQPGDARHREGMGHRRLEDHVPDVKRREPHEKRRRQCRALLEVAPQKAKHEDDSGETPDRRRGGDGGEVRGRSRWVIQPREPEACARVRGSHNKAGTDAEVVGKPPRRGSLEVAGLGAKDPVLVLEVEIEVDDERAEWSEVEDAVARDPLRLQVQGGENEGKGGEEHRFPRSSTGAQVAEESGRSQCRENQDRAAPALSQKIRKLGPKASDGDERRESERRRGPGHEPPGAPPRSFRKRSASSRGSE